jgi:hypothetical protein
MRVLDFETGHHRLMPDYTVTARNKEPLAVIAKGGSKMEIVEHMRLGCMEVANFPWPLRAYNTVIDHDDVPHLYGDGKVPNLRGVVINFGWRFDLEV